MAGHLRITRANNKLKQEQEKIERNKEERRKYKAKKLDFEFKNSDLARKARF